MIKVLRRLLGLTAPVSLRGDDLARQFPRYRFGHGTYAGGPLKILEWGEGAILRMGNYCSIASDVTIMLGGEHRIDWVTSYPFSVQWPEAAHIAGHPRTKGDIEIGSDVWLGRGCTLASGISIGHGAVVGAQAMVTKDVAAYAVVAGNPATVVKCRFDQSSIDAMLRIEWWNWDDDKIRVNLDLLLSDRIAEFIARHTAAE